jgi:hypothetical protein
MSDAMVIKGPDARVHALKSAAPLSSNLRDFPGAGLLLEESGPDYPFGGNGDRRFAFQKFITRSRSFCLRVSGAVAPSAYAFGFGRQVGFKRKRTSPAWDRVFGQPHGASGGRGSWRAF